jgi:hypothetical protein
LAKPPKICAYCGQNTATTKDHVFPLCLFTQPLPANMITVPACDQCNNSKSGDDHYVRDMLVTDYRTFHNSTAKSLVMGHVTRSAVYGSSEIATAARLHSEVVEMITESGIYVGDYYKVPLQSQRVEEAFRMMLRGLYHYHFKQRLGDDLALDTKFVTPQQAQYLWEMLQHVPFSGPFQKGNIVTYAFCSPVGSPSDTVWLICFYDTIYYTATTRSCDEPVAEAIVDASVTQVEP